MDISQIGSTIQVKYKEPTTNADGSPLSDLAKVNIKVTNTSDISTVISQVDIAASAVTGGSEQTTLLDVPASGGTVQDLTITGVAVDLIGNVSTPKVGQLVIDTLAPSPIE